MFLYWFGRFYWLMLLLIMQVQMLSAQEIIVSGDGKDLQDAILNAQPNVQLVLEPGVYKGNFYINKTITLRGHPGAVLDAQGEGDVIRISAPGVVIEGLVIQNSGHNLTDMNAGVFVEKQAEKVIIRDNLFEQNAFGVWLDGVTAPQVLDNRIEGNVDIRSQDRGNGIHLFAVHDGKIIGNEIWNTRDGIYIDTSQNNILKNNFLHDLRYGVHYMYSYSNQVIANHTRNTRTGYALMQSKYLTVLDNVSEQDSNYGMLMNFITHSTIAGNTVEHVKEGSGYAVGGESVAGAEGKAIFIYNSQFNRIFNNRFAYSDIGIHLTAGSEDNHVFGNSFVGNRVQVKYVANRTQEWSYEGRGNYWSDYLGWDMNGDGIGDKTYEPNDAVDKLLWKYPLARILMNSPAIETLRWVQEQFPVLRPQGVKDSQPLMKEPAQQDVSL